LEGKRVIVTGGGSGIGHAIVHRFVREGAAVAVADIATDNAHQVVQQVTADGGQAVALTVDVTDQDLVEAMVADASAAFGGIDVLVNNAARLPYDDILAMSPQEWDDDVKLTLNGAFLCTRAVLPGMLEQGSGTIVNIASVNGMAYYGNEAYSAAKAGVISLTKSTAVRYGPSGIRANAIAPGTVRTPVWTKRLEIDPKIFDKLTSWYPVGRIGEPEDVAKGGRHAEDRHAAGQLKADAEAEKQLGLAEAEVVNSTTVRIKTSEPDPLIENRLTMLFQFLISCKLSLTKIANNIQF
jgi:meso-butanediol dehydrogenase / (S,S)-butanediol dehydrogenase / diacetyl reductase